MFRLFAVSLLIFFPWILATIGIAIFDVQIFRSGIGPIWGITTFVAVAFVAVSNIVMYITLRREFRRGYTTMINSRVDVDVRDPYSGSILRSAKERFPLRMSLSRASLGLSSLSASMIVL